MRFYRRIPKIPWTEYISNEEVLRENEGTIILKIRKRELKFMRHLMSKEGLENLTVTRYIDGKRDNG